METIENRLMNMRSEDGGTTTPPMTPPENKPEHKPEKPDLKPPSCMTCEGKLLSSGDRAGNRHWPSNHAG